MANKNIEDMSVVDHLSELRKRLIIVIIAIAAATGIIYEKVYYLIKFLMLPIAKFKLNLVYFSLTEGFMTRMGISLVAGTIIVSPIILYELTAFINPGLSKNEKKLLYKNLFFMAILLFAGMAFGYILVLPYALNFLISYGQNYMNPLLSGSTYFNFIGIFCFFTGTVFLIPYVIVLLGKLSLINSNRLRKWRKYIIIAILTLEGLFISNAGLITCILVAAPVLILYEISIWIVYFTEKRLEKKKNKS